MHSEIFWMAVMVLVVVGSALVGVFNPRDDAGDDSKGPQKMLFVGDIMLGRYVETLMERSGAYYPFVEIRNFIESYTTVVGNFEGSIPVVHVPTPNGAMRFSIRAEYVTVLARVGFTHLFLANNHAYDYGATGFSNAREVIAKSGITNAGNPNILTADEVQYTQLDGRTVAIIPIHATTGYPSDTVLTDVLTQTAEQSDLQIIYIHWGAEYLPVAGIAERAFAHRAIDLGVDAVIGHHPHVVQNIEEYRGAPIFYSLGNFVFDQYWEDAVREGLTVALSYADGEVRYELHPVTSVDRKSVSRLMNRVERTKFLDALAERSDPELFGAIKKGVITELDPSLASS